MVLIAKAACRPATSTGIRRLAARQRDKTTYGSAGVGSISHFGCVMLLSALKQNVTHVPYNGVAPAMNDLMGGQIDFMCDQTTTALPQVAGGRSRPSPCCATSRCRNCPVWPRLPAPASPMSMCAHGTPFSRRKGTPRRVHERLTGACAAALADPALREQMQAVGVELPRRRDLDPAPVRPDQQGHQRDVPVLRLRGEYLDYIIMLHRTRHPAPR